MTKRKRIKVCKSMTDSERIRKIRKMVNETHWTMPAKLYYLIMEDEP